MTRTEVVVLLRELSGGRGPAGEAKGDGGFRKERKSYQTRRRPLDRSLGRFPRRLRAAALGKGGGS